MKCIFEANTICRLCLRIDEKIHRLDNADHKTFIESIIKLKQFHYVPPDDLYVCYICYALLTKSFNFVQTVWNTQNIISEILKNADLITKPMLQNIDRNNKGLNPITLTSVVICENEFNDESCSDGNTSTDIEEVSLSLLDIKLLKEKSNQKHKCKKKQNEKHLSPCSSSDESEGTEKCNLDEMEVEISNIQIEDIQIESCDIFTKDVIEDACDELKPEKEKKVIKKKRPCPSKPKDPSSNKRIIKRKKIDVHYEPDSTSHSEDSDHDLDPSSSKRIIKRKKIDVDYEPDSTSHSEDSDHDLYDDEGKPIRIPQRVYPMKCDHCDFIIEEGKNHYRHYQHTHPHFEYPYKKKRIYACSICGKLFAKFDIAGHEASHTTQNLKCTFCPKVFPNKIKRYRHMSNVHTKRILTCDYCSKTFKTRVDIIRHIRTHTGIKPFKCHICGDAFAHSGNRSIHIRSKHQNYKYTRKKQEKSQKERRSNKRYSTDTEMTNNEKTRRRTKKKELFKSKNQSQNDDVRTKRKRVKQMTSQNKGVDSSDIAMASEMDGKIIRRSKPKRCAIVQNESKKIYENAETDSDDEVLAVTKTKNSKTSK